LAWKSITGFPNADVQLLDQFTASERHLLLEARDGQIDLMGTSATLDEIAPCIEAARFAIDRMIAGCAHSNLHRPLHGFGEDYRTELNGLSPGKPAVVWYMAAHGIELYCAKRLMPLLP